jgi:hypothetical protein
LPSRWKKFSFVILNFKIWRLFWCYAHDRTFWSSWKRTGILAGDLLADQNAWVAGFNSPNRLPTSAQRGAQRSRAGTALEISRKFPKIIQVLCLTIPINIVYYKSKTDRGQAAQVRPPIHVVAYGMGGAPFYKQETSPPRELKWLKKFVCRTGTGIGSHQCQKLLTLTSPLKFTGTYTKNAGQFGKQAKLWLIHPTYF